MRIQYYIVFILVLLSNVLFGQIIHNADTVLAAEYPDDATEFTDSIYVKFGPAENGFSDTIRFTAVSPYGEGSTITWYSFTKNVEENTIDLQELASSENVEQLTFKTIHGISNQGYRVDISKDGQDTSIYCWAYMNNLTTSNLDYEESCERLVITGLSGGYSFQYFDPGNIEESRTVYNGLDVYWSTYFIDDDGEYITISEEDLDFTRTNYEPNINPAPIDSIYTRYLFVVDAEDSLGYAKSDSIIYDAVRVEAKYLLKEANNDTVDWDEDLTSEAPLEVIFQNNSINAEEYEWIFYNDTVLIERGRDSILRTSTYFEPLDPARYNYPGKYKVDLVAFGRTFIVDGEEQRCVDTAKGILHLLTVYNSFVADFPSVVFLEDKTGDKTDKFYPMFINKSKDHTWPYNTGIDTVAAPTTLGSTSIKRFEMFIYNRHGDRVYHYEGAELDYDNGAWDGTRPMGGDASVGIYYYVVKAEGYDGKAFVRKGFFYLLEHNGGVSTQ